MTTEPEEHFDISNYLEDYMEERFDEDNNAEADDIYAKLEKKERDLMIAAELGKALLNNNEDLRKKNELLMEEFQQKIYELEQEKLALKAKLEAVEGDYDIQMRELQSDIVQLREDVKRQKHLSIEGDRCQAELIRELSEQKEELTRRLQQNNGACSSDELEDHVRNKRSSMHEHLHQLEILKDEISQLRKEKQELERRLALLTDERDNLVEALDESHERILMLERYKSEQDSTIACQEQEILELQETASFLREKLENLSVNGNGEVNDRPGTSSSGAASTSLMAELSESMAPNQTAFKQTHSFQGRPGNLWWAAQPRAFSSPMGNGFPAEEDVELDDDAVMLSMASDLSSPLELFRSGAGSVGEDESGFISEMRSEVLEVYHQLRRMCAELSVRKHHSAPGKTPDELAMVEMDFRLGSLREVLAELKGLLTDLLNFNVFDNRNDSQQPNVNEFSHFPNQHGLTAHNEITVNGHQNIENSQSASVSRGQLEDEVSRIQSEINLLNDQVMRAVSQKSSLVNEINSWQIDVCTCFTSYMMNQLSIYDIDSNSIKLTSLFSLSKHALTFELAKLLII